MHPMSFMTTLVFYFGIIDAVLIMLFGLTIALLFLLAKKDQIDALMSRAFPALLVLVGASVAAAIILAIIRWLLGLPL